MEDETSAAFAVPWGRAAGLFVGCAITVIGFLRSVAPTELLLRVVIGSAVTGMIVRVFVEIVKLAMAGSDDD